MHQIRGPCIDWCIKRYWYFLIFRYIDASLYRYQALFYCSSGSRSTVHNRLISGDFADAGWFPHTLSCNSRPTRTRTVSRLARHAVMRTIRRPIDLQFLFMRRTKHYLYGIWRHIYDTSCDSTVLLRLRYKIVSDSYEYSVIIRVYNA